jgi:hypothetical protein
MSENMKKQSHLKGTPPEAKAGAATKPTDTAHAPTTKAAEKKE